MTAAELMLALMSPACNRVTLRDPRTGEPVTGFVRRIEIECGSKGPLFTSFNVGLYVPGEEEMRTIYVRCTDDKRASR